MKALIVIDMQKDFLTGVLGNPETAAVVKPVVQKIKAFRKENPDGLLIATLDTHTEDYLNTQEGKKLPVPHCIKGTDGWEIHESLKDLAETVIEKPNFGSVNVAFKAAAKNYEEVELIGLCTDICVISNAMIIKAALPESEIAVVKDCCAGVSPESHENALSAMEKCHIRII